MIAPEKLRSAMNAIRKLRVYAVEDLTYEDIDALLEYIEHLDKK